MIASKSTVKLQSYLMDPMTFHYRWWAFWGDQIDTNRAVNFWWLNKVVEATGLNHIPPKNYLHVGSPLTNIHWFLCNQPTYNKTQFSGSCNYISHHFFAHGSPIQRLVSQGTVCRTVLDSEVTGGKKKNDSCCWSIEQWNNFWLFSIFWKIIREHDKPLFCTQ